MDEIAVRAQGVAKQYQLGATIARYDTLRDHLMRTLRRRGPGAPRERIWALRDVSFEAREGDTVGIIGRNGAGKTTLLRILTRVTAPTRGRIELHGRVGSLLEVGTGFHPELTGRENVLLNGAILGMRRAETLRKFDDIVEFAGVGQFIDTPMKRYSSGMQVRLAFAVAAQLEPDILLVDEVLAVGDADFQRRSLGRMDEIGRSGRTVFLVSHNMPSILQICRRAILLDAGRIVADGPAEEVVAEYLRGAYGHGAERRWTEEEAPGNEDVRLRGVRVVDPDLATAPTIDVRSRVAIEIEYEALTGELVFVPWIALFNEAGGHVFSALDTDVRWRKPLPRGTYVSRAWIPEHLLNEDTIVAHVTLLSLRPGAPSVVHAASGPAVAFQVVDGGGGPTARGDYVGRWPAPVRPLLEWTVESAG